MKNLRSIEIEKVCNEIVKTFLPKGTKDKVLTIGFNLTLSEYNDDETLWYSRFIEFCYFAPNNYIQVGYRLNTEDEFIHVANHDSCWREGARRGLREAINDVENAFEEKGFNHEYAHYDVDFGLSGMKLRENTCLVFKQKDDNHYEGTYVLTKLDS